MVTADLRDLSTNLTGFVSRVQPQLTSAACETDFRLDEEAESSGITGDAPGHRTSIQATI